MKNILIIALFGSGLTITGCKKYLDVNKDPNNPIDVQESLLLSPIELNLSDNIQGGNASVNVQNYLQNIAPNQLNPGIWNYQSFNVDFDGDWNNFYVVSLNNLKILDQKAESDGNANYAAIAKILTAYTLGTATDYWGDIPYSKAFNKASFLVPYDPQAAIYDTVQALLTRGIANIDQHTGKTPGADDFFYNGDMSEWRKAAWALKARYAIHLTKAPSHTASAQADEALADLGNAMTSSDDDMQFPYAGQTGSENIWFLTFSPVTTYVLNETLVDSLMSRNDPRLPVIAQKAAATNAYHGRRIGSPLDILDNYSYPNSYYASPASANFIITYGECLFIKAEATFLKSGAAAAEAIYESGIQANMSKLGVSGAGATAYIGTRTLTTANALQRIMEEKAMANVFNFETWIDWRRTGFPALTPVDGALSAIPRRILYPESEILTNAQPQQSAKLTDRVWWDQ